MQDLTEAITSPLRATCIEHDAAFRFAQVNPENAPTGAAAVILLRWFRPDLFNPARETQLPDLLHGAFFSYSQKK